MNWRTAHNHRKRRARRRVFYAPSPVTGEILRFVVWSQNPRRPVRPFMAGGKAFYIHGPVSTVRRSPA